MLTPGDPAPWFTARSTVNPTYQFDSVAGRYIVLCFFGSAADPFSRQVLTDVDRHGGGFDVENVVFFGVSNDPDDETLGRVTQRWQGVMYFWDFDRAVSRLYGAADPDGGPVRGHTLVLDQAMRTIAVIPFAGDPAGHFPALVQFLNTLRPIRSVDGFAPVLVLPDVFERAFCRTLIDTYERHGGYESGYMKDVGGKSVHVVNHVNKRRADCTLQDPGLIAEAEARLRRRLVPEIKKAFQFDAAHIERYIVACYDAADGGFFKRHRDNTTRATAHRRFAVTLNLNAEEYEGGELSFAEFGPRAYKPPTGGAVVFSCALTHEVRKVTQGKRYAFLPFLYDDAGDKVRQANLKYLDPQTVHVPT